MARPEPPTGSTPGAVTGPAGQPSELGGQAPELGGQAPGSAAASPGSAGRPAGWRIEDVLDLVLRVAGGCIAVVAAVLSAALELLLAYLRLGGPLAGWFAAGQPPLTGVSVLLAAVGNVALAWFAYRVVGRVWAIALPAVAWFLVMFLAAGPTTEGDILLTNWVGVVMIFAGSMAFAVTAFRFILADGQRSVTGHQRSGGWTAAGRG